jgi:predicted RNA-binding protein associated with RNAse of E/G family
LRTVVIEYLRPPGPPALIESELLQEDHNLTVFRHPLSPSAPIDIGGEIVLGDGFTGVWFLYSGETYDVGRIHDQAGRLTGYYCDMILPMQRIGSGRYSITDLFLDLWVSPNGQYTVLDRDEFEEAVIRGWVTSEQAALAERTLNKLLRLAEASSFPPPLVTRTDLYPAK